MGLGSSYLMDFPLPVPACCRASGKRNWEGLRWLGFGSDAVSIGIAVKVAGGGHGSQTLVEGGVADAAQRPQFARSTTVAKRRSMQP